MTAVSYVRLIGFSAGALLNLFLLVLIVGYRRPRNFERVLFFLALSLFLFYSGLLLELNSEIYYPQPPLGTVGFAVILVATGLGFLPALLVHLHAEHLQNLQDRRLPGPLRAALWANYLPGIFLGWHAIPRLFQGAPMSFLRPGGSAASVYGVWLGLALLASAILEWRFAQGETAARLRIFYQALAVFFACACALVVYTYAFGGPQNPAWSTGLATAVMLVSIFPTALLGYFVLRYNFLEIGGQRNLVYAVSGIFIAAVYLAIVRRVETWLEPVLPPEATAGILLFILVVFFEPVQRRVSRALRRGFQKEVDRLQRLSAEIHQEARRGDLNALLRMTEERIEKEFGLAFVRIRLTGSNTQEITPTSSATTKARSFILRSGREEIGALEAAGHGAFLSGETYAALEFIAEQLPASIDLCRLIEEKLMLERKLAERERLALVGQMAASISHNLKNPLGSMKTVLQVQLENRDLPAELRKDGELVVREIDRLSTKLNQLLQYAKPPVRNGAVSGRIGAGEMAEQVVALLGRQAERRNVKLKLERGDQETFVRGSEAAWSDILTNLIVNAIEVLPAGGAVHVRLIPDGKELEVNVTDDGPGIPAELQGRIFQPFFSTKPSGTGLGLAIVERRVAEMHGKIEWKSPARNGRGTQFTVRLPLAD